MQRRLIINVYKFIQTIDHLSNSINQLNKKAGYKFMHMTQDLNSFGEIIAHAHNYYDDEKYVGCK
jgi:hypothetical protein